MSKSSGTTGKDWQTQVANEITREPWYSKRMMEVLATMQTAREAAEGMECQSIRTARPCRARVSSSRPARAA